jgi:hypothetical protein
MLEKLSPGGANQPFNEGTRNRDVVRLELLILALMAELTRHRTTRASTLFSLRFEGHCSISNPRRGHGAKLLGPDVVRAIVAENILLKPGHLRRRGRRSAQATGSSWRHTPTFRYWTSTMRRTIWLMPPRRPHRTTTRRVSRGSMRPVMT